MSAPIGCDKDRLVAYLYDEAGPAERHALEAHLARCADCARELGAFRGVRQHLAAWDAPEIDLGFRITREPLVVPPRRTWWPVPAWAQAMAAVLLLVVGAALANLDLQYGGFALRVGWQPERAATAPANAAVVAAAPAVEPSQVAAWQADLERLARDLRGEIAASHAATAAAVAGSPGRADGGRDAIVEQVRVLIAESERRQQRELALRLTQTMQDLERQRRTDLVRIEQSFGQLEGFTGAEAARQRELLNYLMRVSTQQR
jgi:anti-sigma factor RsiW